MTRIRHTFTAASALVLALGLTACTESNEDELILSDSQLLQAERCDAADDDTECERTRDDRALVRVARDVRPEHDRDCSDLRGADRYVFIRFGRRCVVVDRVGRDSLTCATVLCGDGAICVDSRDGYPICRDNPRRDCSVDVDCGDRLCIENMCARQPHRTDSADRRVGGDREARDHRDPVSDRRRDRRHDRVGDRARTDRPSDRPSDRLPNRHRHDRRTDRVTDRATDRADRD